MDASDLIRTIQDLSFCRDLDAVMRVLRTGVRSLTGADGATVVLREGDLCHYADEDAIAPLWKGKRFPMSACISGWCMLHGEQVAIPDIYADERIPHEAYRPTFVKSLAMTPIRRAEPIGAIGAYWASRHAPTREELDRLQALGDAASTAFESVKLFASLQEASSRKDEFLLMLAHELRNPLAPIRNAAHVLRIQSPSTEAAARAHGVIDRQVAHMTRIIDDLLDVSRITRGRMEVRRERVDLARLAAETAQDYRGVIESAGLRLRTAVPELPVWVMGDSVRLVQIVGNLLDNARKFTPSGEIFLSVWPDPATDQAVLRVKDTGIGMAGGMLTRVFEAFDQADRSLARTRGGLGLGLSLAKGVVELHGGTIVAESRGEGMGTELLVRIPLEAEPAALTGPIDVTGSPARASRVLVVEDNRDAAETLRMVLEMSGFEAHVAFSGIDGVKSAKALRPHVILSDIGLPGMDGYALARAVKDDPATAPAHLIAITGYGDDDDRRRVLDAGFAAHLVKPVAPERLLSELAAISV